VYTNAQVAAILAGLNARLDALEGARVPTSVPAQPSVSAPVVIPERTAKASRWACSLHPDHKGRGWFTANGIAYHRANCPGTVTEITR